MANTILESELLKVQVSPLGAQLSSLVDKRTSREMLWNADPSVWPWHAPNLFPVVGQCKNDIILIGQDQYSMKRHGFARNSMFTLVESTAGNAIFSLKDSPETLKSYPFHFEFQILYALVANTLSVTFKVINHTGNGLHFSLGAHPAFAIAGPEDPAFGDYYVEFGSPAPGHIYMLDEHGLFTGQTQVAPIADGKMHFSKELFDHDALVFKDVRAREVRLKRRHTTQAITLTFPDFPYLGIWSKPGSAFVCLEPWIGCADTAGADREFKDKEGMRFLEKGHVFEAAFTISVAN